MTLPLAVCPCGAWHPIGFPCDDFDDVLDDARYTRTRGDQLDDLVDGLANLLDQLDAANLWDGVT